MSELIDFYQQQAATVRSDVAWLAQLQEAGLVDFERLGFPSRQHEEWKYTWLDAFLQQSFVRANATNKVHSVKSNQRSLATALQVHLINEQYLGLETFVAKLPTGVIVQPIAQALVEHAEKIMPYLGRILQHEHGFHALNTAMLQYGLFVYLPAGIVLQEPLLFSHWQAKPLQAIYIRHLIIAEEGSSASIIEDYQGKASTCYFTNTITEIYTAADAKITHYKMQCESKSAYHVGQVSVKQAKNSGFDSHLLSVGGKLVRNDITIRLFEPKAHCLMNGLYLPNDGQHMDQHTLVLHEVPDCTSEQDYKGILMGRSRGVFSGKVLVAKDAQHTCAKQKNKNLLLSSTAEIDTKPQLDIYADDVVCTHGATVGQLDEEALFYLATRGINREDASQYLMQAFVTENLRAIPDAELLQWMNAAFIEACMPSDQPKG
jgi:Fe-S cluster assembly protein SufD